MRVLYVSGDDYIALNFEEHVKENKLTFEQASKLTSIEVYGDETEIEVEEKIFEEVCPKFIKFIKLDVMDYDSSKHSNFYTEDDEIFKHNN